MAGPVSIGTLAALTLAGAGAGLYLGKSAIAEIDPVYFSSPYSASNFHADLVPGGANFDPSPARLHSAGYFEGVGEGCVRCKATAPEFYRVPDYSVDYAASYTSYVAEPAEDIIEDTQDAIEKEARRAALAEVERYAHFPVTAEEKPLSVTHASLTEHDQSVGPEAVQTSPAEEEAAPAT